MLINKIEQQSLQRKLNPLKFILKLEHKQLVSWLINALILLLEI